MSLRQATQHLNSRSSCLRSSYAEISRFVRTRNHGTAFRASAACSQTSIRKIGTVIRPDSKAKEALDQYRTTYWSALAKLSPVWETVRPGSEVAFCGYLQTRRDVNKKLSFTVLRNIKQNLAIQIVSNANVEGSVEAEAHNLLKTLREWTPVVIKGIMKERTAPPKQDPNATTSQGNTLMMNTREIALTAITPLNEVPKDIIIKSEAVYGPEQRHLQLRTDWSARGRLITRSTTIHEARKLLHAREFVEIETPLLFKSTPEGAREFLVPTRNKGLAYALPQSPQQYKQILMASGFPKYYQFARCFRDEDLRADRQPEFTQLDMEMSFADEETVMTEIEALVSKIWSTFTKAPVTPFPRMTYHEAMSSYGSDKPDLRYSAKVKPDFIGKITSLKHPAIDAFKMQLSDDPATNRKFIADFFDSPEGAPFLQNPDGQPATFCGDARQPMGGLGPLGHRFAMEAPAEVAADHGDLLVMQARPHGRFTGGSTTIGNLRLALYKAAAAQGLIEPPRWNDYRFVWITDFPLFSPTNEAEPGQGGTAGLASTHHPFTAPKTASDLDLLLIDPTKAIAAHYDIVVNGVELGGGSRRIHNAEVQEFIFRDVLKMKPERIEDFRHLLDVLRSGCPPHAGIALGWDRLMTLLTGCESVRDVIAFSKSGSGEDALVKSPNRATKEQWEAYHLKVAEESAQGKA
ncbi:aspartyl-tRNA synthetase-like protein [Paraphaeosphaeria sporulosa]|uniref:Aspartyl-tRNA synthetase-like protein n=1 Tax=Paraphaeosphaeria sporulosa TaxID=1460663 RepID=A0A177CIW4_9PLEO|nr:aspartyl-tRNA synthetase-like protein [Paraphaeosphaeria sporulosa]OAG06789.1 aspartyl-tRNA synthetase-like protein [Paraphaeosphaeria sporulosa]